MSATPPGWYDDGHGALRWWDGEQWTEHVRAPEAPAAPAAAPATAPQPAAAASVPPYASSAYTPGYDAYGVDATAAPLAAAPPAQKSKLWILWVVLGVVVLLVVIAGIAIASFAFLGLFRGATSSAGADGDAAVEAVELYDDAWNDADCDKYLQSTTEAFRESIQLTDCASFEEQASYFGEATDDYEIQVTDVTTSDGTIVVQTTETYSNLLDDSGEPLDEPEDVVDYYTYTLVPADGGWAIDSAQTE